MHYKDTTTGEYYGFKANSNCIEVTVEEIKAEREAAKTPEEIMDEKIALFTGYVDETIMAEITAYNKTNYTVFTSPEGVEKYNKVGASHYAFANSLSNWIVSDDPLIGIWKKARTIQADVIAGTIPEPTKEAFIAMLPTRGA